MSSFWDIFSVLSGTISDLTTISSGVGKIGDSLSSQIQLSSTSQTSATFGGVTDTEISASLTTTGSTAKYGEIYDPAIDALRPQTLDEALSSVNQSIVNAPSAAPQSYIDSLKSQQYDLINDKLSEVSQIAFPNVADLVPNLDIPIVFVPAFNIPDLTIPSTGSIEISRDTQTSEPVANTTPVLIVGVGGDEVAASKMKPMEPSEPVKSVNPSILYGETHTDFTPVEEVTYVALDQQATPEQATPEQATPEETAPVAQTPPAKESEPTGKGIISELIKALTPAQRPSTGSDQGGVYGETGYVPYQFAEDQSPSPFPLLIGAGLLFIALEKKRKK